MRFDELRSVNATQIFRQNAFAGILRRTERGAVFEYDPEFRASCIKSDGIGVAINLSPATERHEVSGANVHPFFAGLLPEGLRLKALRRTLKTSEDDLFTMLLALGNNCVGDVYAKLTSEVETESPVSDEIPNLADVSFMQLFEKSISSIDLKLRDKDSGIPGVMPKLSAAMISFPLRVHKRKSQYLLKLQSSEHPLVVQNEYFFMNMARKCGLNVPNVTLIHDRDGEPGLLVERFDRAFDSASGDFRSLHQEDLCQLLDRYPQDKYRLSMRDAAMALERVCVSPLIEIKKLIELYLFSYLIGNGDLHAKNISVLLDPHTGIFRLSPCYDLLTTLPYGDRNMALMLEGKNDNLHFRDFTRFAARSGIPEKALSTGVQKLVKQCSSLMDEVGSIGFPKKKTTDIMRVFNERAKAIATSNH